MGLFDRFRRSEKPENNQKIQNSDIREIISGVNKATSESFPDLDKPLFPMAWIKDQERDQPTHWSYKYITNPVEMNYRQRALAKSMENQPDEVIKICELGLRKFPNSPYLMYMAGRAFLDKDKITRAIEIFDSTISLYPDFADCYVERGVCKYSLGDKDGSDIDFSIARKIEPNIELPELK